MSNTQSPDPIVYVPVPVSEKPPLTGFYFTHLPHPNKTNEFVKHVIEFKNGEWRSPGYFYRVQEWLKPTPLSELLKDKQKRIEELEAEVKRLAYLADYWQEKRK